MNASIEVRMTKSLNKMERKLRNEDIVTDVIKRETKNMMKTREESVTESAIGSVIASVAVIVIDIRHVTGIPRPTKKTMDMLSRLGQERWNTMGMGVFTTGHIETGSERGRDDHSHGWMMTRYR